MSNAKERWLAMTIAQLRSNAAPQENRPRAQAIELERLLHAGSAAMPAKYRKVTAIVRVDRLVHVEKALQDLHVSGVSVSQVKGYGEYADFFARDWMSPYARVEIFTSEAHAERISGAVLRAASTGTRGDGIVAVEPVESVLRIRSSSPIPLDEI